MGKSSSSTEAGAEELVVESMNTLTNVQNEELIMGNQILRPSADLVFDKISIQAPNKTVLHEISGTVKSGEILALMGPSGSGKTSLLNFLSHRHELIGLGPSHLSGSVYINNRLVTKRDRRRIGYVMQQDLFFETLTLKETVTFYALVRLPRTMSREEKIKKALDLVEFLGLSPSLNTMIGGGLVRGLSGGEKKRASIITEMITDPEILFLDEPTSGLDSNMAMNLVGTLKMLSEKTNKTIIASIHQPNSKIFFSFSKLLLLSQGKLAYFGQLEGVVSFFDEIGLPCPRNWNAADHIIDMARSDDKTIQLIVDKFRERNNFQEEIDQIELNEDVGDDKMLRKQMKKNRSSYWEQLKALSKRSFRRSAKDTFTFLNLIKYLFTAFIISIVWFQTPKNDASLSNFIGLMFFSVITNFVDPFFTNIFQFAPESIVIRRERMSAMYRLSAYYIAKVLSDMVALIARPTLMWTIIYWTTGLSASPVFLASLIHLYLMGFLGQALGLLVSSFGFSFPETMVITTIYFFSVLLLGGFYNNDLPVWLSWVKYLSPIHYGYSVQLYLQLSAEGGLKCLQVPPGQQRTLGSIFNECNRGEAFVPTKEVLLYASSDIPVGYYILLSFTLLILSHIAAYFMLSLSFKRSPNRKTLEEKVMNAKCWNLCKKKKKQQKA